MSLPMSIGAALAKLRGSLMAPRRNRVDEDACMISSTGLVDFHCHLDLYPDHAVAVRDAEAAGVFTLAVTTTPRAWPRNHELAQRSEEHTSELQSLMRISYDVFCLKKKHTSTPHATNRQS